MTSAAPGLMMVIAGVVVLGIVLMPTYGNEGAGGTGATVCDVSGSVSGKIYDVNVDRKVEDQDISLTTLSSTCHVRGVIDWPYSASINNDIPLGALFGKGATQFKVTVSEGDGKIVAVKDFTVETPSGKTSKFFQDPVLFKNLEQGKAYKVNMHSSFSGSNEQDYFETFTVG